MLCLNNHQGYALISKETNDLRVECVTEQWIENRRESDSVVVLTTGIPEYESYLY